MCCLYVYLGPAGRSAQNIQDIYKYIQKYTHIYKIYTNIYKIYTKYQAAARRRLPGQAPRRGPGPARAPRGRAGLPPPGRRLVFCIYLVYAHLEANILILGCWQPLTRMLHPSLQLQACPNNTISTPLELSYLCSFGDL